MNRKIITLAVLFFSLAISLEAFDISTLNGIWISKEEYDSMTNHPGDRRENSLLMTYGRWAFWWDEQKQSGIFRNGIWLDTLKSIESLPDGKIRMKMVHPFDNGDSVEYEIIVRIVSYDILEVISNPFFDKNNVFRRVFDSSKKEIAKGAINNERVRLRNNPDLASGVLLYLDLGERVGIFGRTSRKQRIGELEDYWYEVYVSSDDLSKFEKTAGIFWSGWVFGAYLDVEDRAKLDAYLDRVR